MNTITKLVVLVSLCVICSKANAQDTLKVATNQFQIDKLQLLKEEITKEEKEYLKQEVENINERLEKGEITKEQADELKQEAAKKRALNIENRIAIVDNKIALLQRNEEYYDEDESSTEVGISIGSFSGLKINRKNKPKQYDKRTTSALVFAIGLNNAIIDDVDFGKTPYSFNSGFVELGWAWKTRLLKESNAVRLKYGFSFQWNKFSPKDDKYFIENGNMTTLETFSDQLKESEFRVTNLVVPVHFEFGPSKKIEKDTYFRYKTTTSFKFGIGGYAGFNTGTQQKLRYKEDGDNVKQKIRKDYNTTDFVYGLSAYIGAGGLSLYAKYDLNTLFKDQLADQHNVSLGIRFDLD
ncbi:hypothetical protein M0G43_06965 [Subsaxibacter sp. CAU 1640]|uniref:hypothetical protein n=1 Tax=Subsaxibacter sp. CAU 1640 TaxID=2933271 RepID=UPI0020045C08|nr:hypothetical protein [Subsaxibacter sp. CAU 1640]MCK7590307.1 hypothetical protein [Subsaxibacter sp. CAU 1640]